LNIIAGRTTKQLRQVWKRFKFVEAPGIHSKKQWR